VLLAQVVLAVVPLEVVLKVLQLLKLVVLREQWSPLGAQLVVKGLVVLQLQRAVMLKMVGEQVVAILQFLKTLLVVHRLMVAGAVEVAGGLQRQP
jgi:hypothetical protein